MSKVAVQLYNQLYPFSSGQNKELTDLFIDSSGKEDDIDLTLQRLFNWHFYDPGSRLGHTWWGARKANTIRFANLAEKVAKSDGKDPSETYELAGRLVHHIQDMSSPPHTVPVYHTTKDMFDKYATNKIVDVKLTSIQLDSAKSEQRDFNIEILKKLLKDAAEKTISRVGESVVHDGRKIADDWTEFWRKYELIGVECRCEPCDDFGCYGKNIFGRETVYFTKAVYDKFYEEQVACAIEDTLRLLILLHKRPQNSPAVHTKPD